MVQTGAIIVSIQLIPESRGGAAGGAAEGTASA
jgi:hypothetical protein